MTGNTNGGWVKISRDITEMRGYFKDKFNYPMCWIDLIILAEWRDQRIFYVRGNEVVIKRGQVAISVRELASRWKMSVNTVRGILSDMQKEGRINIQKSNVINIISILNYEKYQSVDTQNLPRVDTENDTQTDTQIDTQTDTQTDTLSLRNIKNIKNNNITSDFDVDENPVDFESEKEKSCAKKEKELEDDFGFETFWNLYDKKVGKEKVKKKWIKLKQTEREKIFATLPAYIQSTPNKQYRKNPETYMNQKSWNDEIIKNYGNNKNNREPFEPFEPSSEQSYFDTL